MEYLYDDVLRLEEKVRDNGVMIKKISLQQDYMRKKYDEDFQSIKNQIQILEKIVSEQRVTLSNIEPKNEKKRKIQCT